jgi:hypothetical protein
VDEARTRAAFPVIRTHVLLAAAGDLGAADAHAAAALSDDAVAGILAAVPDALLAGPLSAGDFATAAEARERYTRYLCDRLRPPRAFVAGAAEARAALLAEGPRRLDARR